MCQTNWRRSVISFIEPIMLSIAITIKAAVADEIAL